MRIRLSIWLCIGMLGAGPWRAPGDARADLPVPQQAGPTTWHLQYANEPKIELQSSPPQVKISLSSESSSIGGVTPFEVPGNLHGRFRLEAFKAGYEYVQTGVRFVGGGTEAGARPVFDRPGVVPSLLSPPGWIEWRAGHRGAGSVLLGSEAGALFGVFWSHARVRSYRDDAERLTDTASDASGTEAPALEAAATRARARAGAWEDARLEWAAVGGSLWAISALSRTRFASRLEATLLPERQLALNLQPISRSGVWIRSLLLPGWGQSYAGRLTAGRNFMGLGLGLLCAGLLADHAFDRAEVDLAYADARLDDIRRTDPDATPAAIQALDDAQSNADRISTLRYTMLGMAATVWAANLVDSVWNSRQTDTTIWGQQARGPSVATIAPWTGRLGVAMRF